ncbi:MAG: tetratricopeptide repeat protein [Phycisphaera sp.]|nr:tetratricopeptide repeat protein [Phycisphaera sp.]
MSAMHSPIDPHLRRAQLLIQQRRYDMAADELRQALAQSPDDPIAHAMLGICLADAGELSEAAEECGRAVHLGPDVAMTHYALATVLNKADRYRDAEIAAMQAVHLEPGDPHHYALLSMILLNRKQWQAALNAAEVGLQADGENVDCLNFRAVALTKLGRRDEAGQSINDALRRRPDDPHSHANMGWTLLHEGKPNEAMPHFKEALRLEPNMEWARLGIVEALKARNIVYRSMLRFALWMGSLSAQLQWGLIIGLIVVINIIGSIKTDNPYVEIGVNVLIFGYVMFVMLSWMADSLFNLIIRTDPFGRLALSDAQKRNSTLMGLGLIFVGALAAAPLWLKGLDGMVQSVGYVFTLLAVAVTLNAAPGRNRQILGVLTLVILAAAAAHFGMLFHYETGDNFKQLGPSDQIRVAKNISQLHDVYTLGSVGMTWLGSIMATRWRP